MTHYLCSNDNSVVITGTLNNLISVRPFVNLGIGTSALELELELELILQTPLFPLPQGLSAPNIAGF